MDLQKLQAAQKQVLEQFREEPFYQRAVFNGLKLDNYATGIMGGRGVGKTTYLLHTVDQYIQNNKPALYISADSFYLVKTPLLELVETLYNQTDIRLLCIDEIHKYTNWAQELKNIADTYKDFRILFSGSSMIDIVHAKYDLSRRVTLHNLHGLSFREYLEFTHNIKLEKHSLEEILKDHVNICNAIPVKTILKEFNDYCDTGYFPFTKSFTQERDIKQAIENITKKVIYEDVGTLKSLKTPTLLTLEKLFLYIVNSFPGELNTNKLANLASKDFDSTQSYLQILKDSGLIRAAAPKKFGKAVFKNSVKLYPENTNFIFANCLPDFTEGSLGKKRETFFLSQLQNSHHDAYTSTSGDFEIDKNTFEIGGKNKTAEQIKDTKNAYIVSDGINIGFGKKIPLYLFGFLY